MTSIFVIIVATLAKRITTMQTTVIDSINVSIALIPNINKVNKL